MAISMLSILMAALVATETLPTRHLQKMHGCQAWTLAPTRRKQESWKMVVQPSLNFCFLHGFYFLPSSARIDCLRTDCSTSSVGKCLRVRNHSHLLEVWVRKGFADSKLSALEADLCLSSCPWSSKILNSVFVAACKGLITYEKWQVRSHRTRHPLSPAHTFGAPCLQPVSNQKKKWWDQQRTISHWRMTKQREKYIKTLLWYKNFSVFSSSCIFSYGLCSYGSIKY